MKEILIIHSNMYLGGAETSLLGMLENLDYNEIHVDLLLLDHSGELMPFISPKVNLLKEERSGHYMMTPIVETLRVGQIGIGAARLLGKMQARYYAKRYKIHNSGYLVKQFSYKNALSFLPKLDKEYDLAISFIDPHYMIVKNVKAKKKLAWLHTDFGTIDILEKRDFRMWDSVDHIVCVSESCRQSFIQKHEMLEPKTMVIENILSTSFVIQNSMAKQMDMKKKEGEILLLSIGRFTDAKNFDNVPFICRELIEHDYQVKWYLIGFGQDEALIKDRIKEAKMENQVIILGKKSNPYPYLKACDLYVQPSRYEGKSVAVREAQMLGKPVVITAFPTAVNQLEDGVDGVIVPLKNKKCAKGIMDLIDDKEKQKKLSENCKNRDYSNRQEIYKLLKLCDE